MLKPITLWILDMLIDAYLFTGNSTQRTEYHSVTSTARTVNTAASGETTTTTAESSPVQVQLNINGASYIPGEVGMLATGSQVASVTDSGASRPSGGRGDAAAPSDELSRRNTEYRAETVTPEMVMAGMSAAAAADPYVGVEFGFEERDTGKHKKKI